MAGAPWGGRAFAKLSRAVAGWPPYRPGFSLALAYLGKQCPAWQVGQLKASVQFFQLLHHPPTFVLHQLAPHCALDQPTKPILGPDALN